MLILNNQIGKSEPKRFDYKIGCYFFITWLMLMQVKHKKAIEVLITKSPQFDRHSSSFFAIHTATSLRKSCSVISVFILLGCFSLPVAFAETPTIQNSIEQIDPGRTAEELTKDQSPEPPVEPEGIEIHKPAPQGIRGLDQKITFKLNNIILKGNTVFADATLQKIYQEQIGKQITATDLINIAAKITAYYRDHGYILSQATIPPQEIDQKGIATLQIIEGYISAVNIQDNKSASVEELLTKYGAQICKSRPLQARILERYALLANDIPGASVKTVLTMSKTTSGAADLTFIVNEQRTNATLGANNYNAPILGPVQLNAGVYINNLLQGSQTGVQSIISSTDNRLLYFAAQHKQIFTGNGLGGDFSLSNTKTKPDLTKIGLDNLYIPGEALLGTANLHYPMIRSRKENLIISGGFKYLNSHSNYIEEYLSKDNLRSININVIYDFLGKAGSANTAIITFSQGLNILGAEANPPTRVGGKTNFEKIDLYLASRLPLYQQIVYLSLAFQSQYAFTQLLSSETFGYGGVPFGYGYDQSELTGDHGVAARIELQYQKYMQNCGNCTLQFFGFWDGGIVWNINKTTQLPRQSADSTGIGVRSWLLKNLVAEFAVALPLDKYVNGNNNNNVKILFNVQLVY